MIPLTRPWIDDAEIAAVTRVLASGMLVQGKEVERFESRVAEVCQRAHAVAVANGTSALAICLEALGLQQGDEVVVPALTWPSPAYAAIRIVGDRGLRLVDVDGSEWNATPDAVRAALSPATKAIVAIDQFGVPVRDGFRDFDVPVLEDAACALGSNFADGRPCGGLGLASCLSFHPRKLLTTGEGGMVLTDDGAFAARLRQLRNHGQSAPGQFAEAALNHRMTDFQAALGCAQMDRLSDIIERRREHANAIREALPAASFQRVPDGARANEQTLGLVVADRDRFIERCRALGVGAGRLSYALPKIDFLPTAEAPIALDIEAGGVALPLFPQMTIAQRLEVISVVGRVLEELDG